MSWMALQTGLPSDTTQMYFHSLLTLGSWRLGVLPDNWEVMLWTRVSHDLL